MRRWSLRSRMLALSLAATALALAIAGWTMAGVLGRLVTEGIDRRLDAELSLLAGTVGADGTVDRALLARRSGALEEGRGWRWRIDSPGGSIGPADLAPREAEPPLPPDPPPRLPPDRPHRPPGIRPLDGVGDGGDVYHARRLAVATRGGQVVLTAAAPRAVVRRPVREALVPLLGTLAALAALLAGATLAQLRWGLRPLRELRDAVAAIRRGERDSIDEDQPAELRPLAAELNRLAADNAAALATARLSAANLAHALKTPVATLALALEGGPAAAQVERIDATIRHHLARARIGAADRRAAVALAPAIADLVAAVRRLHAAPAIETDAAELTVAVDPHDLDEIVGNLLDNAARHARSRVTIAARPDPADPGRASILVADDGPGIAPAERERATRPGTRLDERGDGHGFGLGIVGDLVALYGGTFVLGEAPGGGLSAELTLPLR